MDILSIRHRGDVPAEIADAGRGCISWSVAPNPFTGRVVLRFDHVTAGPSRVAILDMSGGLVRTLSADSKAIT